MKKLMLLWILPILFVSGCVSSRGHGFYGDRNNWVIRDIEKTDAEYDVFYVYPTLAGKAETPEMEWVNDPKLQKKIIGFAKAQTYGVFGKKARVFSPFVHQLTFASVARIMKKRPLTPAEWKSFERGMKETVEAFRYYLLHYNQGRPYVLLGHSQGAMDLYYLLKNCPEINVKNGFTVAYLAGLPHCSVREIRLDFGNRIKPAENADDLGVVAVWNTQNAEGNADFMAGKGSYCINPLNWRTDDTPASREQHLGAYFYDYRNGSVKRESKMFGAQVDPARGVLIVDLPSDSEWDAKAFMGRGIFHMNDVWFFAGNICANAEHRIGLWKKGNFK